MNYGKAPLVTILLMGGCLILFFSAKISQDLPIEHRNGMNWALVIGGFFVADGLLLLKSENAYIWCEDKLARTGNWLGIYPWQALLLIISPIFAILATNAAGFWIRMRNPYVAVIAWLIGIACAICGGWHWTNEKHQISRRILFWFLFVTILAFIFRGVATDRIPILLTGDEGSAGINAAEFAHGEWNNIFITGWFAFPSMFPFIQSLSIRIFGQTTEALRLPSALVGALTVGAIYIFGKAMFNQRTGLLAALFLATFHFHIHFSRLGINNIWDGLWFTITIGALWYGWRNNHRGAFLFAGIGLGLSQYFYTSSRVLIGIIPIAFIMLIFFQRDRIRLAIPHFLITVLTAIVIVTPLAWFYINEPYRFMEPIARVFIFGNNPVSATTFMWKTLFRQLAIGMQAYTYTPILFWYAPETPILRPMAVLLFYLGLIYLVLNGKDSRLLVLSLWLIAIGLIGGLSDFVPAAQRYVAAAPACALIVGYGLHSVGITLEKLWHKSARFISILIFGIMAVIMTSDLYFYYVEYTLLSQIENINSHGMIAQELANYLKDKPPGANVAFLGMPGMGYYSIPSTRYLSPHVTGIDVTVPWKSFDISQLTSERIIFVFLPEREEEILEIMKEYPNGKLEDRRSWNNQIIFWTYDCSSK